MATNYGLLADRPAFGNSGDYYYARDTGLLYLDSGSAWSVDKNIATHRKILVEIVLQINDALFNTNRILTDADGNVLSDADGNVLIGV